MADLVLRQVSYAGQSGDEIDIAGIPLTNTQIDQNFINLNEFVHTKAPIDNPIFTGSVTIPAGTIEDTAIGQTTPRAGSFTSLSSGTINLTGGTMSGVTINSSSIGATTAAAGKFTTLTATDNVTFNMSQKKVELKPSGSGGTVEIAPGTTTGAIDNMNIGGTTPGSGSFTNVVLGKSDANPLNTITANALFVSGTKLKTSLSNANTLSLSAYDVDNTTFRDLITLTASNEPTLTITSTGPGTINNMIIGGTTAAAGTFTNLTATSTNGIVNLSPTGTGTVTINPAAGSINNMSIGATTASTGTFTNLTASSANGIVNLSPTGTGSVTINPTTAGTINNMIIGGTTAAAGTFTNLTATSTNGIVNLSPTGTGTVTINPAAGVTVAPNNANVSISPTGTGSVSINPVGGATISPPASVTISPTGTGSVTINPATAGTINNMSIGATTASTGKFTDLNVTGSVTLTTALPVTQGGTGASITPVQGGILYADSTSSFASTGAGTQGFVLKSNGDGAPTWEDLIIQINDETTDATRYITFTDQTQNVENRLNISSGKFTINPSTGVLSAPKFAGDGTDLFGVIKYVYINGTHIAAPYEYILADTSTGAFNVTLPATPANFSTVKIFDQSKTFGLNSVTVLRNGSTIEGESSDLILNRPNTETTFVYYNGSWRVFTSYLEKNTVLGPSLIGPTFAYEFETVNVFIQNYISTSGFYNITTTGGTAIRTGSLIKWTLPPVTLQNETKTMTVEYASVSGTSSSIYTVNVINSNATVDSPAIIITDFSSSISNTWTIA